VIALQKDARDAIFERPAKTINHLRGLRTTVDIVPEIADERLCRPMFGGIRRDAGLHPVQKIEPPVNVGNGIDRDLLPGIYATAKLARQMETSDAAKPIYRRADHRRSA
jgi:hypothetical protein